MFGAYCFIPENNIMSNTRRSLILALVAAAFVLLFIKSPTVFPGLDFLPLILSFAVFGLSSWGLMLGIRSLKQEGGGIWQWLAAFLNGALLTGFFLVVMLLFEALRNFN